MSTLHRVVLAFSLGGAVFLLLLCVTSLWVAVLFGVVAVTAFLPGAAYDVALARERPPVYEETPPAMPPTSDDAPDNAPDDDYARYVYRHVRNKSMLR